MKPLPLKKRRIYFFLFCIIFFLIIPPILLYTSGYRVNSKLEFIETGGIYIYSPQAGSDIFIDNKKKYKTTLFNKDFFVQNLSPDTYKILIAKDGFWPWAKEVEVREGYVSEAIAFLIPKQPVWNIIPEYIEVPVDEDNLAVREKNSEYVDIYALLEKNKADIAVAGAATTTPGRFETLSNRKKTRLWSEETEIFAQWTGDESSLPNYFCRNGECRNPLSVFYATEDIKSLGFYPGRDDVIIFAVGIGIYVIEIDSRIHQNFQPLYKGNNPFFIIKGNSLYAEDNGTIFSLAL